MSKSNIIYKVTPPPFCQRQPLPNQPMIIRLGKCEHNVSKYPSVVNIIWVSRCNIYYNLWDLSISNLVFYTSFQTLIANERVSLLKLNDMKSYRILNEMKKGIIDQFYLFNLNHLRKVIAKYPTVLYKQPYNVTPNILESWRQTADKVCDSFKGVEKKIAI